MNDKYRPIKETFPFLDVTLSNGELAAISVVDVNLYTRNITESGTRVALHGRNVEVYIQDNVKDFESRLFAALNYDPEEESNGPEMSTAAKIQAEASARGAEEAKQSKKNK